jgi:hypothetical protein
METIELRIRPRPLPSKIKIVSLSSASVSNMLVQYTQCVYSIMIGVVLCVRYKIRGCLITRDF